ncbi:MAG: hypothetical protein WKG07_02665 [Hymenobacter sp.]
MDANARLATDSLAQFDEFSSSLLLTGLHRTATEIANRQRLTETVGGGHLGYRGAGGNLLLGVHGRGHALRHGLSEAPGTV